jgi:periplasmic divalent cation tolerance protein
MKKYLQVITTVKSKSDAEKIADILVEKKLSVCVQISGPITSVYRWQGKVEKDTEWRCVIKTSEELYSVVERTVKEIHGYETPEIVALPIEHVSEKYLKWMEEGLM